MLLGLDELFFSHLYIVCSTNHVLVEANKLLSLVLHFNVDVLSYGINVLHYRFDLADLLLPLLYDLLHVVCLSDQL